MQAGRLWHSSIIPYVSFTIAILLGISLKEPLANTLTIFFDNTPRMPHVFTKAHTPVQKKELSAHELQELFIKADALFHDKKLDDAMTAYKEIITKDPTVVLTFMRLGTAAWVKKEFNQAEYFYQTVLVLQPNYLSAYIKLGLTQHELKKYDQAIDNFKKALTLEPNNFQANYYVSKAYAEAADFDNAMIYAKKAIELQPKNVHTHLN